MVLNKRGTIIRKNDIIQFDENQDHIPNLEFIVSNYYQDYKEYIGQTTNAGLCIAITNTNDIVMINATYDQQLNVFVNYLPSSLDDLNKYQIREFINMLNEMTGIIEITSYAKQSDFENIDKKYTKEELLDILELKLIEEHIR